MKEILQDHYNYTLYENEQDLVLSVVCGTVAVFDVNITLHTHERERYEREGKAFIDSLADKIRFSPDDYATRYNQSQS